MSSSVLHFSKVKTVAIFVARSPHKKQTGKGKEKEGEKIQRWTFCANFVMIIFFMKFTKAKN